MAAASVSWHEMQESILCCPGIIWQDNTADHEIHRTSMILQKKLPPIISTMVQPIFGLVSHIENYIYGPDPTPNRKYITPCISPGCSSQSTAKCRIPTAWSRFWVHKHTCQESVKRLNIRRNKPCIHSIAFQCNGTKGIKTLWSRVNSRFYGSG